MSKRLGTAAMSDEVDRKDERLSTPKASSAVKEHARKILAKLRAKVSGGHASLAHIGARHSGLPWSLASGLLLER